MAYVTINPTSIEVGDPITKELFDLIKSNADDHETRIGAFESGAVKITVFQFEVVNDTSNPTLTGLAYYTALQNFTIQECYIQIFTKGSRTGFLEIDVKKSSGVSLVDGSFSTIFTTKPKITYATDADYAKTTNQVLNAGQAVVAGEVLKLDLTAIPAVEFIDKFLICCYGEI